MELTDQSKKLTKKEIIHSLFPNYKPNKKAHNRDPYGRSSVKADECSYNTNYDIVNEDTILISNRRESCFANFTGARSRYNKDLYHFNPEHKNKKLYAYALTEDIDIEVHEVRKWIKLMKTIGLPFEYKELNNYSLNYNDENGSSDCFSNQKVYCIILNYNDYTSIEQMKILLYLFRYIYENNLYETVREVIRYSKTVESKFDFISAFFLLDLFNKRTGCAHVINHRLYRGINNESFMQYLNTFDDSKNDYKNALLENLETYFDTVYFKYEYQSAYYGKRDLNASGYKLFSKLNISDIDYTKSIEELIDMLLEKCENKEILAGNSEPITSIEIKKITDKKGNYLNDDEDYGNYDDDDDDY